MQIPVVHVYPVEDWIDHSTDMEDGLCACGPTVHFEQNGVRLCMVIQHRRVDPDHDEPEFDGPVRFWSRRRVFRFAAVAFFLAACWGLM